MPTSTNTIWVDSSFIIEDVSSVDAKVEYEIITSDSIGNFSIPLELLSNESEHSYINIQNKHLVPSGINQEYYHHVSLGYTTALYTEDSYLDLETHNYVGVISSSGTINTNNRYFNNNTPLRSFIDIKTDIINGNAYYKNYDTANSYVTPVNIYKFRDLSADYINFTGSLSISGVPIPLYYNSNHISSTYIRSTEDFVDSIIDNNVSIFFAGWVDYTFGIDILSSDMAQPKVLPSDVEIIEGNIYYYNTDTISSDNKYVFNKIDTFSSDNTNIIINSEAETTYGSVSPFLALACTGDIQSSYSNIEVSLYSIRISDISVKSRDFVADGSFITFSITDDVHGISVEDCVLFINDAKVLIDYDIIEDGANFKFVFKAEDFINKSSVSVFRIYAENNIGMSLERIVYLTFGYVVEYRNNEDGRFHNGYGFNNKIAVRVEIIDSSVCNSKSTLSWDFESKQMTNSSLSASINGRLYDVDSVGLNAEICPISTAYFYNKEFNVVIKAKDLAGNAMDSLYINFRIEEKP